MEGGNKGIPRVWSDSEGHKATITLFSEMADWQVNNFSDADTLWHKEEAGKGRKWMPKKTAGFNGYDECRVEEIDS